MQTTKLMCLQVIQPHMTSHYGDVIHKLRINCNCSLQQHNTMKLTLMLKYLSLSTPVLIYADPHPIIRLHPK